MKKKIVTKIKKINSNDGYKAEIFLCLSLFLNMGYAAINAVLGIIMKSAWFGTMAFYYIVLSLMRYSIVKHIRNESELIKWKRFRRSGDILFVSTIALVGMSILLQRGEKIISYPGHIIYAVACYTFYAVGVAIYNIQKYRKIQNPIYLAGKLINLAAAVISMFSLESAMTSTFGKKQEFNHIMGICTGVGAFIVICLIAVYMIVVGKKEIKRIKTHIA